APKPASVLALVLALALALALALTLTLALAFALERLFHLAQFAERLAGDLGEFEVERLEFPHQGGGNGEMCEPLLVGRHDKPGRIRPAGLADHVLVGVLIFVPELALGDIAHRKLPALTGLFDAGKEPLALLFFRDVEEEFQDQRAIARQMMLEGTNI